MRDQKLNLTLSFTGQAHLAKMRDEEAQTAPNTNNGSSTSSSAASVKRVYGLEGLFGSRGKYKLLWALCAIILLALWSMFTGSVTLKWSAVNLKQHSLKELDTTMNKDLDVLDVDEREKMVRQMWNVYKHNRVIRLPSFWRDAFAAAYQDLTNEVSSVRNTALLEIAKLSFRSTDADEPPSVLE